MRVVFWVYWTRIDIKIRTELIAKDLLMYKGWY